MSELPEPLVNADVDLRDFAFFPVEFRRLFSSDTWILGTVDERCAAFCLWCESWHGSPASSIPDNDRVLAHLSQSGPRWAKVRSHVLRGWIKCSDGRLYHPVVAEKVLEAWAKHSKASSKGKAGAKKRWGTGNSGNSTGNAPTKKNDAIEGKGIEGNRSEGKRKEEPLGGSINHQQEGKSVGAPRKKSSQKTSLPDDFKPSNQTLTWATENGYTDIERHCENFVCKSKAKGYVYVDWQQAFQNAIRADWAGLRKGNGHSNAAAAREAEQLIFGNPERDITDESKRI